LRKLNHENGNDGEYPYTNLNNDNWEFNTKEKSNSKTKVETNYVWNKSLNWLEMLDIPQLDQEEHKLKTKTIKVNISLVLEEWRLTTDGAELKIGNRSNRDLTAGDLFLHHEKM